MKTETIMAVIVELVTPKSRAIWLAAGATMEEEIGLINVKDETTSVAAHFRLYDQLDELRC